MSSANYAQTNLSNCFLIAMPNMEDPVFAHTITYICEHNEHGAMGIVINKPLELTLGEIFNQLDIRSTGHNAEKPIFSGGPVQVDRGFVLHPGDAKWESTLQITHDIHLTTSKDILSAIADDKGPKQSLVALGYTGWMPGQLEKEMANNAWLTSPANPDIIFNTPLESRCEAAAALLGVDLHLISLHAGHA